MTDTSYVLGIDPGLAYVGWAVLKLLPGGRYLPDLGGIIATSPELPLDKRLRQIFVELRMLLSRYPEDSVAAAGLEGFAYYPGRESSRDDVNQAVGVIKAALTSCRIKWLEFSAQDLKRAVGAQAVGRGRRRRDRKEGVKIAVQRILHLDQLPKDHVADAYAAAIAAAHRVEVMS